jgi:hypothetical protein
MDVRTLVGKAYRGSLAEFYAERVVDARPCSCGTCAWFPGSDGVRVLVTLQSGAQLGHARPTSFERI